MTIWKADILEPGHAILRRTIVETMTVREGGWYDIRKNKRWDSGNVVCVKQVGAESALCEVYRENKRSRREARELLGEFAVPYPSFEREF